MPKKRRGRPPLKNPESAIILLRVRPDKKRKYRAAAKRAGTSLSQWLKLLADEAINEKQ